MLYRESADMLAEKFCCIQWGVHVFPPFDISTNPNLVKKFKEEILSLNEYYRERCELCWNNDAQNTNRKEHENKLKEVNKIFNDNYRKRKTNTKDYDAKVSEVNFLFNKNYEMAEEAKRINEVLKLNTNNTFQNENRNNKKRRYSNNEMANEAECINEEVLKITSNHTFQIENQNNKKRRYSIN
jgi:hypothetical protein